MKTQKHNPVGRPVVPINGKPSCPKCGSNVIYIKTLTQEIVCRRCGSISPIKKSKRVNNGKENKT